MRGSLKGVLSRVDRLASKLGQSGQAGCPQCRGREERTQIICVYGDAPADLPTETRCDSCGRVIPFEYVAYDASMKPPEEPD